jgi:hypothetical protein
MCLYLPSSVLWCPLRFPHKAMFGSMFGSSLPPVVCGLVHVLFVLLYLFACPAHIVLCFSSSMLPVSLDCPFVIALSLFSIVYLWLQTSPLSKMMWHASVFPNIYKMPTLKYNQVNTIKINLYNFNWLVYILYFLRSCEMIHVVMQLLLRTQQVIVNGEDDRFL